MNIRRMFFVIVVALSDFWSSLRFKARIRYLWRGWQPKNWPDELEPKKKKAPKRKVIREGRKRTFGKRFKFFFFAIIVFSILGLFIGVFRGKFFVKLALAVIAGWYLLYKPLFRKGYVKTKRWKITLVGFWLIYVIGVYYLDYFINLFQLTMLVVIVVATIVFATEEKTGKNFYPHWVMYVGMGLMIFFVGLTIHGIFQPHEYYVNRQKIFVADLEQSKRSATELRARLMPVNIPGLRLRQKFSEKGAGRQNKTWSLTKQWISSSFRVCQPAEFKRISLAIRRIFLVAYTFISLILFFLIAAPEVLSGWLSGFKGKRKGIKGKERTRAKEGSLYETILMLKGAWEFFADFVSVWHKKEFRSKK